MLNFINTYWLEIILAFAIGLCVVYYIASEREHRRIMQSITDENYDETEHGVGRANSGHANHD